MSNGINDPLSNNLTRNLISDRCLGRTPPSPDPQRQLGHHKIDRLIHQRKNRPSIDLIGRDGLSDLGTMKVRTFDF